MKVTTTLYVGALAGDTVPKSQPAIAITTGKRKTVAIRVVSNEGRVVAVFVQQKTGTTKAFDVEVLTSAAPYPVGEAAYNAAAAQTVGLFRAIPKQSGTAGNAVEYFDDYGLSFNNVDQASQTENKRELYLTIIPANTTDPSTWEVRVVTETQVAQS